MLHVVWKPLSMSTKQSSSRALISLPRNMVSSPQTLGPCPFFKFLYAFFMEALPALGKNMWPCEKSLSQKPGCIDTCNTWVLLRGYMPPLCIRDAYPVTGCCTSLFLHLNAFVNNSEIFSVTLDVTLKIEASNISQMLLICRNNC